VGKEHLNIDQYLTKEHINGLTSHKEMRQLLYSLKDSTHPMFPTATSSGHIKINIVDDGSVFVAGTPSDHRAVRNNIAQLRRTVRENVNPEWEIPESAPFQQGKKKKKSITQRVEETKQQVFKDRENDWSNEPPK
jgi:hypothetical protein